MRCAIPLVVLLFAALTPERSAACTCIEPQGTEEQKIRREIGSHDLIAEVRVVSIETVLIPVQESRLERNPQDGKYRRVSRVAEYPWLRATVEVTRLWKGRGPAVLQVLTPSEESACGLPFSAGQEVLLYAAAPDRDGKAGAELCSRTQLVATAEKDLQVLRRKYPRRHLIPDATSREP